MTSWITERADAIGRRAERDLRALVAVSSPSGDVKGAEECASICAALVSAEADVERVPCSSTGHAPDTIARVRGTGSGRILLLGHLDTVVPHVQHRRLESLDGRLVGSGAVDMKGGVVLSLGVLRALALRPADFAEVALLLVCDEEWRTEPFGHTPRFAGWDACLCFEAGELTPEGQEAVIVRRKAASTVRFTARGRASHSGSAPDLGRNALLTLASVAQSIAAHHDPDGGHRLTAVPTVIRAGDAFNVVPAAGQLLCDLRADDAVAFDAVLGAIPKDLHGVTVDTEILRLWPGMDSRGALGDVLERAAGHLGRPVEGTARGGASDASHFAGSIPLTIDGLGPRGGSAHNPEEYVLPESLRERAEVALAVVEAILAVT